ncbi:MAG: fused MFS/spermidine synthase [Pseudomonadota bacterium]
MHVTDTPSRAGTRAFVPVVFIATIFLSASLLFFVQPLFTRIVLPIIGGSPAVWTTAMLFFQTVLIAGYLYAHVLTRHLKSRFQLLIHLAVWAAALVFLPLAVPDHWTLDPTGPMAWQTLMLYAVGVGLPFFALSANAPLIQYWYARSGGPSAEDPYFLYGASNLGSLAALLAFPLIAEPLFGASKIGMGWAVGFCALGAFLLMSGLCASQPAKVADTTSVKTSVPARRILTWAFLAFIPSSLMLSVTSKISLDIGAVPLVWVVPLALYLLTFVLTFTHRDFVPDGLFRRLVALVLLGIVGIFSGLTGPQMGLVKLVFLVLGFFVVALYAHRKLYLERPDSAHLTLFYLTMSVGGALGGLFNSIIAPMAFNGLYEASATALLAGLMLLPKDMKLPRNILRGGIAALVVCLPAILIAFWTETPDVGKVAAYFLVSGFVAVVVTRRNLSAIYGAVVATFLASAISIDTGTDFRDRSFFGMHRIQDRGDIRVYSNGTTIHGGQRIADDTAERPQPIHYYHPKGPIAQVVNAERGESVDRVGVVGLGVGSLSCYSRPHQNWQYYEIDPMVVEIARKSEFFRFMDVCAGDDPVHLGDARITLTTQSPQAYDVLVIDAYSSDSVPVHLTTNEAVELYMSHLSEDGILVFHISNRYYDISLPLARSAEAQGLEGRIQTFTANTAEDPTELSSEVVILARNAAAFGPLDQDPRWTELVSDGGAVWTDDHANLLSILK